jgi:hypothetical protein
MVVVLVKEAKLIVAMNDLDFGIRDVAFEVKVFNRYGTFDQIQVETWKIQAMHIYIVIYWIRQF